MPTKIRLQRYGKKGKPFYHIVIADGRAPRDGRYIERIGSYDPITNPADIQLDFDKAISWMNKGAMPTETVRSIFSFKGVLYKNHLLKGVNKGALTEEEAEIKFQSWLTDKEEKVSKKVKELEQKDRDHKKKAFAAETKIKEARDAELAKKRAQELEKQVKAAKEAAGITAEETEPEKAEQAVAEPVAEKEEKIEEVEGEVKTEESEVEAKPEEEAEVKAEEPVAEVTEEPAAEVTEEPVAEVTEVSGTIEETPEPEGKSEEPVAEAKEKPESKEETTEAEKEKKEE